MRLGVAVEAGLRSEVIPGVGWGGVVVEGNTRRRIDGYIGGRGDRRGAVMMITVIQLLLIYY
jgi:hypothetical protein